MPYVPSEKDLPRLRAALDRASFSEGERILWLLAFSGLAVLDGVLIGGRGTWIGMLGSLGGFALLYWRIRGGHLADRGSRAARDRTTHRSPAGVHRADGASGVHRTEPAPPAARSRSDRDVVTARRAQRSSGRSSARRGLALLPVHPSRVRDRELVDDRLVERRYRLVEPVVEVARSDARRQLGVPALT